MDVIAHSCRQGLIPMVATRRGLIAADRRHGGLVAQARTYGCLARTAIENQVEYQSKRCNSGVKV